jgi:hypothetical protein
MGEVVCIETREIKGMANPGPPYRDKKNRKLEEAVDREVAVESTSRLRNCHDKNEIIKEL